MGAAMGAGRVVGLLLPVVLALTMPGAAEECEAREYFHEGLCCELCEAGHFVAAHCNASHSRGKCDPCTEGKDFSAHADHLEKCTPCRQCREDQITLRPCTLTQDAECQCKEGYSCPDGGCEMCQRNNQTCTSLKDDACSICGSKLCLKKKQVWTEVGVALEMLLQPCVTIHFRHPDGKEIVPSSTATTEPASPSQGKEALGWVIPLIVVVAVVVAFVIVLIVKNLKCNRAALADAEGGWIPARMCSCEATSCDSYKVHEPSQIIVEDLSPNEEETETFRVFIKEVPPQQWNRLMETVLQENDINEIISKFPNNGEEQSYQMFLIWRNRVGQKHCIIKLLDALRCIDSKAYYSISNTLKSKHIIS